RVHQQLRSYRHKDGAPVRPKLSPGLGRGLSSDVAAESLDGSSAACVVVTVRRQRFELHAIPNRADRLTIFGRGLVDVCVKFQAVQGRRARVAEASRWGGAWR